MEVSDSFKLRPNASLVARSSCRRSFSKNSTLSLTGTPIARQLSHLKSALPIITPQYVPEELTGTNRSIFASRPICSISSCTHRIYPQHPSGTDAPTGKKYDFRPADRSASIAASIRSFRRWPYSETECIEMSAPKRRKDLIDAAMEAE